MKIRELFEAYGDLPPEALKILQAEGTKLVHYLNKQTEFNFRLTMDRYTARINSESKFPAVMLSGQMTDFVVGDNMIRPTLEMSVIVDVDKSSKDTLAQVSSYMGYAHNRPNPFGSTPWYFNTHGRYTTDHKITLHRFEDRPRQIAGHSGSKYDPRAAFDARRTPAAVARSSRMAGHQFASDIGGSSSNYRESAPVVTPLNRLTMTQAFGSKALNVTKELGIDLVEKPNYWRDLEQNTVHYDDIGEAEMELGSSFKAYGGDEIYANYGGSDKPKGPLASVKKMPAESMFIVQFDDGSEYLADQTGASTYIRNWVKIA